MVEGILPIAKPAACHNMVGQSNKYRTPLISPILFYVFTFVGICTLLSANLFSFRS